MKQLVMRGSHVGRLLQSWIARLWAFVARLFGSMLQPVLTQSKRDALREELLEMRRDASRMVKRLDALLEGDTGKDEGLPTAQEEQLYEKYNRKNKKK